MTTVDFESAPMFHAAVRVMAHLDHHGYETYLVGGCVRDTLLGRAMKDFDIATSALPEQVEALFPGRAKPIGAKFGVIQVQDTFGLEAFDFEVATFRSDGAYSDNRRPDSVRFSKSIVDDLERRDFTINAMAVDLFADALLVDYKGGQADLRDKVIRCVGAPDARFQEDALRMLRAVRFACQLDFEIDAGTERAMNRNAHLVKNISAERIIGELNKILTSGCASYGIRVLYDRGLLEHILPEVIALKDCPQNPKWHPEGNVWLHTLGLLKQLPVGCSLTLALGCLLHDIGKPACLAFKDDGSPNAHGHEDAGIPIAEAILQRLKYPNDIIESVLSHIGQHMAFSALPEMRKAKQLRFIRQDNFDELLELHRIDRMAAVGDLTHYNFAKELLAAAPEAVLRPRPFITGDDLIKLGFKPGPIFKKLLLDMETCQLEGTITTREAALAIMCNCAVKAGH